LFLLAEKFLSTTKGISKMELKDLNDTLIAHKIIELALQIATEEAKRLSPQDIGTKTVLPQVSRFIPAATRVYLEARTDVQKALRERGQS